jgi:cell division protein FtsZ
MSIISNDLDSLKYELHEETRRGARIKVLGVGGAGSNAVARMMREGLEGPEFYILNTDAQALESSPVPNKIQIGTKVTQGLGAGSDPNIGRQAALEDTERILELLQGADMVFVTAGLGGGTGAGAAPVIASLAKELDALTVAVVTKPFAFEGAKRMKQAERSMYDLASSVDTLITIPNDRLLSIVPRGTSFVQAFRVADDVLRQAVQGISDIILTPGIINLDFSDIRCTMLGMGHAMMGTATASGENAAVEAARAAINCPLLEDTRIAGSRRVLINLTGSSNLGLHEVNEACSIIREAAQCDDVQISFGVIANDGMGDTVKVTVIATGFRADEVAQGVTQKETFFAPRAPVENANANSGVNSFVNSGANSGLTLEPRPEPIETLVAETEVEPLDEFDPNDLEAPAYLRRGKLVG